MSSERSTVDYGVFVSYYLNFDALFGSSLPMVGFQNITYENITIDIPGGKTNGSKSIISGSRDDNRFDEFKGTLGIHGMALVTVAFAIFTPTAWRDISSSKMSISRRQDGAGGMFE